MTSLNLAAAAGGSDNTIGCLGALRMDKCRPRSRP